jgi:hypothetical protein
MGNVTGGDRRVTWVETFPGPQAVEVQAHSGDVVHLFRFVNVDEAWRLVEVVTQPQGRGVVVGDLRAVPLAGAWAWLRYNTATMQRTPDGDIEHVIRSDGRGADRPLSGEQERSPRSPKRTETDLARIAARYVELVGDGLGQPVARLAEELADETGRGTFTAGRARALLADARSAGLLTQTRKSQPGGRLTAKAERLLRRTT